MTTYIFKIGKFKMFLANNLQNNIFNLGFKSKQYLTTKIIIIFDDPNISLVCKFRLYKSFIIIYYLNFILSEL